MRQGVVRQGVTLDEHMVDFVNRFLAAPRGRAGPQRRYVLEARHPLAPRPPADETARLARQVAERVAKGIEPQPDPARVNQAIVEGRWGNRG